MIRTDNEGLWYYHNSRSGKVQWKPPTSPAHRGLRQLLSAPFNSSSRKSSSSSLRKAVYPIAQEDVRANTAEDEALARALQEEEYNDNHVNNNDLSWLVLDEPDSDTEHDHRAISQNTGTTRPTTNAREIAADQCSIQECGICMDTDNPEAEWTWLECAHNYHTVCIMEWLKTANRCPICRTECSVDDNY